MLKYHFTIPPGTPYLFIKFTCLALRWIKQNIARTKEAESLFLVIISSVAVEKLEFPHKKICACGIFCVPRCLDQGQLTKLLSTYEILRYPNLSLLLPARSIFVESQNME